MSFESLRWPGLAVTAGLLFGTLAVVSGCGGSAEQADGAFRESGEALRAQDCPAGVEAASRAVQNDLGCWKAPMRVVASDAKPNDLLGFGVALDDNLAAISAYGRDAAAGVVFLYDATTGQEQAVLEPSDPGAGKGFGFDVDLSPTKIAVGAIVDSEMIFQGGAAFVFDVTTGALLHILTGNNSADGDRFGFSVGIGTDTALVGAAYHNNKRGGAYRFDLTTGEQIQFLAASDETAADTNFGINVAITNGDQRGLIGGWQDDPDNISQAGSAYLF